MKCRHLFILIPLALALLAGCVEDSSNIVTFDEVLESTTFNNKLLTPVVIYRDGVPFDTLAATSSVTIPIGKRGPVRNAWRIIAPTDRYGSKVGLEPYIDLGVQYAIRGNYTITNDIPGSGIFGGRTLFTPLVANFSTRPLRLTVNFETDDQVVTNYLIPHSIDSILMHAPYFFWNSNSNVRLESTIDGYYWMFSRDDTTSTQQLQLDPNSSYSGSGRTVPLTIY